MTAALMADLARRVGPDWAPLDTGTRSTVTWARLVGAGQVEERLVTARGPSGRAFRRMEARLAPGRTWAP